jgi:predicted kinase
VSYRNPFLLLMVGLPGAGKTTRAAELAAAYRALRLTPDEWMIALFDGEQPDGKRAGWRHRPGPRAG